MSYVYENIFILVNEIFIHLFLLSSFFKFYFILIILFINSTID